MAAKCLVAVLILWLLIREVDAEILMRTLAKTSVPLLVLGVLLNVSTVLIAGLRWKLLIRAAGLPLAKHFLAEVPEFDPARSDAVASFVMPASPQATTLKPDGS